MIGLGQMDRNVKVQVLFNMKKNVPKTYNLGAGSQLAHMVPLWGERKWGTPWDKTIHASAPGGGQSPEMGPGLVSCVHACVGHTCMASLGSPAREYDGLSWKAVSPGGSSYRGLVAAPKPSGLKTVPSFVLLTSLQTRQGSTEIACMCPAPSRWGGLEAGAGTCAACPRGPGLPTAPHLRYRATLPERERARGHLLCLLEPVLEATLHLSPMV